MFSLPDLAAVDFETDAIAKRPHFPPAPVGVAIMEGRTKFYMSWGHPEKNNCTRREAQQELLRVYKEKRVVFHNAAFDIEVGTVHLKLPTPKRFEDTLYLAYLNDPRDKSLGLKQLAEEYLSLPPDEQTELKEWILANVPGAKKAPTRWGAHISQASMQRGMCCEQ